MKNLLIIHQGALGDFVATFPAILRLRKHFCQIDALCQSKLGKLACALNVADKCFPLEAAFFSSLYTDAVDPRVQNILRSYNEIVLFSYYHPLEQAINKVTGKNARFIPPRADVCQPIHVTEHILSHLLKYGLLKETDAELSYPDKREGSYDPTKILLHPGSGSRRKNWPLPNFAKIEKILTSEGMKPEFILGPAEYSLAEDLKDNRSVHKVSDLEELASLLRKAGGFIGNDSGVSHLAGFMGVPTVAIFGPSDPDRWKPTGRSVSIIRPDDLECSPCFEITRNNCDKTECLDRISIEKVSKEFVSLMSL
ncbi:glycosyltransferase family 9 protein [Desulfobacterales bacterium HSG2]|nr:glycosyltransferase family 9 protein [Desulfobacterales bacterium HSG2]